MKRKGKSRKAAAHLSFAPIGSLNYKGDEYLILLNSRSGELKFVCSLADGYEDIQDADLYEELLDHFKKANHEK